MTPNPTTEVEPPGKPADSTASTASHASATALAPAGRRRIRLAAADGRLASLLWFVIVLVVYGSATLVVAHRQPGRIDPAMTTARHMLEGRLDLGPPPGANDTVTVDGRTYQVISPLPIVPYLAFAPFPGLWSASRWLVSLGLGLAAAWLALPLARRYGPGGSTTWWLASLFAFGTLLLTQAVAGNFYYLGHVEAMLFTFAALVEMRGRARPWLIATTIGLAALARPTVLLAIIPIGIGLVLADRRRARATLEVAIPVGVTLALTAIWNALRIGSPLDSGYGSSALAWPALAAQRAKGLFSIVHVPANLDVLLAGGFDLRRAFPFLVPNDNGQSLLLTTPAVLVALRAGFRGREAQVLWLAALVVLGPLLLYYGGGGFRTYGYRYALDFTPFLLALVALGARRHFGTVEKGLIVLSMLFVSYGIVWSTFR